MSAASDIDALAARWLVRREEAGWTETDQAELDGWLEVAPEHKIAFWRLEHGWRKADRLTLGEPYRGRRSLPSFKRTKGPMVMATAAAIAACVIVGVVIYAANWLGDKTYATDIGVRETVPLADGTLIELNTGSQLRAIVTAKTRSVWLDRGEAYFEVAHDAGRPFVVHAGAKIVTVLGTKFSVRRDGDRVEVVVVEGRVRVDDSVPIKSMIATRPTPTAVVTRGDVVIAQGASTLIATKAIEKIDAELSWRRGLLTFDQSTLADAASEFNRYNRKKIVINDKDAAAIRIGGSFEAENLDVFTRLLQRGFGLKIEDDGNSVKISR